MDALPQSPTYDPQNVFARILRKEIPSRLVYEDEFALAFPDIRPQAPVHVLVICRTPHVSMADFCRDAPAGEVAGFFAAVARVAAQFGLEETGYRLVTNHGPHSGQEVPHFHVHILGGQALGPMVAAQVG